MIPINVKRQTIKANASGCSQTRSLQTEQAKVSQQLPNHPQFPPSFRVTPSPVHPLNAGAPSSKVTTEDRAADPTPTEQEEGGGADLQTVDSQPQELLTH